MKIDINIYTFHDLLNHNKPYDDLMQSMQADRLVPILGSGFTKGLPSKAGIVPSSDSLKEKLLDLFFEYFPCDDTERHKIKSKSFSQVSDCFIDLFSSGEKFTNENIKDEFATYMENFYSGVHNISSSQREFLQCGWPYLYTLNYDSAVESVLKDKNYEVVVPYRDLNLKRLKEKHCIIKLHGDVYAFLQSGNLCYCVLSKKQYLKTITDPKNKDLMSWLQDDYSSKDILFIGCGLENEYDFLFVDSSKQLNGLSEDSSQNSYYIYYDESPQTDIPADFLMDLHGYGIKNVLRITPTEIDEFYCFIKKCTMRQNHLLIWTSLNNTAIILFYLALRKMKMRIYPISLTIVT